MGYKPLVGKNQEPNNTIQTRTKNQRLKIKRKKIDSAAHLLFIYYFLIFVWFLVLILIVKCMLFIASDHGGFELKEEIKRFLEEQAIPHTDLGPESLNPNDDYPDFAIAMGLKISADPLGSKGILLCRSGQGVNIVANKFPHVRAALVWNEKEAVASRTDDLANVLSIPTDYITPDEARNVIKTWLNTPLGKEDRHMRRVAKIDELEGKLYK